MKKKWLIGLILLAILCQGAASLTTRVSSYRSLDTLTDASNAVDTDLAAATGFGIGAVTGELDLLNTSGGGKDVYSNTIVLTLNATTAANGDTLTQKVYGRTDGGPPQLLGSIVWTIGTARADGSTATFLWADTAVVTASHLKSFTVADGTGSGRVVSVGVDLTGFRYITSLITAQTGDPVLITVYYRYF